MLDRTDLQEQIMELPTDELMGLLTQFTGYELEVYDEEQEIVVGGIESLAIDHPPSLKTWLGFMLYALGERIASQESSELE